MQNIHIRPCSTINLIPYNCKLIVTTDLSQHHRPEAPPPKWDDKLYYSYKNLWLVCNSLLPRQSLFVPLKLNK